jgi:DNA modification methylase
MTALVRNRVLRLASVRASELVPHPRNWRAHPEKQAAALRGILAEIGYADALLARELPDGRLQLVDGHLRAETTPDIEVPVLVLDLTEAEAEKLLLSLDPLAAMAEANAEALEALLRDVATTDDALRGMYDDLAEVWGVDVGDPDAVVEDEVPEPPADPVTKPGDLWILGEHRVLCGDATRPGDVARVMAGELADAWLTDPPYNVAYVGGTKDALTIENDSMPDAEFRAFLRAAYEAAFAVLKPGGAFYIWHADSEGFNFRGAAHDCGQRVRQCLIWKKDRLVLGRQDYQWRHEPCLYGWKDGAAHEWYSDRSQTTVLEFDRPTANSDHPTMKPVALIAYLLGNSTAPRGVVFDGFLGSGTTLVAAEQLGRKCRGLELSPGYCDVIVKRWETLTGKTAVLAGGDHGAAVSPGTASVATP